MAGPPGGPRSHVRGVSAERRVGARGAYPIGRYTMPDGQRRSLPGHRTRGEAFEAARTEQDKLTRARCRDPRASRMTFAGLVHEHYLPTCEHVSPVTRKQFTLETVLAKPPARAGRTLAPPSMRCSMSSVPGRTAGSTSTPCPRLRTPRNVRPRMTTGPSPRKSGP